MLLQLRLFGVQVRIHLWFLATGLLLWWMAGSEYGAKSLPIMLLLVLQGVLFHELGHALMGRLFGLKPTIDLMFFSGVTRFQGGVRAKLTPGKSMAVSFAGPFVGLVLGGAMLLAGAFLDIGDEGSLRRWAWEWFVFVNLGWGVLNLLPIMPLDGGNIMAAFFQLFSREKGIRAARYVSLVFIAVLLVLAFWAEAPLLAVFLGLFAMQNVQLLRAEKTLRDAGLDAVRSPEDLVKLGYEALEEGDGEKTSQIAMLLLRHAQEDTARDEALHLLAWGRLLADEPGQAREALDRLSGQREPDPALEGAVLLALGRATLSLDPLERALAAGPSAFVTKRYVDAVIQSGDYGRAARFLAEHGEVLPTSSVSRLQASALQAGDFMAALTIGERAFEETGEPLTAFNAACALARLGRADEALGWLERALDSGLSDVRLLDDEDDLDPLRGLPGWAELRARAARTP
ncbi:MAG TPA: site-2 protease family protein [Polyangiaceae bacterium LLY-WYZ-15_(1-7)]|nr:hypothetical protein [Sandaracinus sp.]HJL00828.1 site-2 protease family protein [Polyangiaceae bacterium LLY-WYZ-15_(1-7)]MBJ73837.1 hypothetical protein [Sandaracinus sp.]HJL13524.1 site-2 protease family protein [Polyangiaceae bacterium LLY-WYZ-15_(1-7)]HJL21344.1 site-2 protease family protein [Polyangiaceae bacterium LLY-WYZ-15_(1-7)]